MRLVVSLARRIFGKSISMYATLGKLLRQPEMNNSTLVVTGRNDLDGQLYQQFCVAKNSFKQTPEQAESRRTTRAIRGLFPVLSGWAGFFTLPKSSPRFVNNSVLVPMNTVLLDFENGQEVDLTLIGDKAVSLVLLLGPNQKLKGELVEKLMEHAASIQLIRLAAAGRNAVDFALAFYLGKAATLDPTGFFHIISKDTGYDPLIEHLKSRHIKVRRHNDFTTLPFTNLATAKSVPDVKAPPVAAVIPKIVQVDAFSRVLAHLRKNATSRPKRLKTLTSQLTSLLKPMKASEVDGVIAKLRKAGHVAIGEKDAVTYLLG